MRYVIRQSRSVASRFDNSDSAWTHAGVALGKIYNNKTAAENDAALLRAMDPDVVFLVNELTNETQMRDAITQIAKQYSVENIKEALEAAFQAGACIGTK